MYFIEEGNVSIRLEQEGGEVEISVLSKGAYFGELALVTHRPRAASAYASENIKVACKSVNLYIFYCCVCVLRTWFLFRILWCGFLTNFFYDFVLHACKLISYIYCLFFSLLCHLHAARCKDLERNCFERLLGDCTHLIKRGIRNYPYKDPATFLDILQNRI